MSMFPQPPHPHSFPPSSRHPRPVSPATASNLLTLFLTRAAIDPSRRPDSTLSNRGDGPQSNSGGTGNVNLTLFHLERIGRGIRGEDLGMGRLLGVEEDDPRRQQRGEEHSRPRSKRRRVDTAEGDADRSGGGTVPEVVVGGDDAGGWQDKSAYELSQDLSQDEVGDRDPSSPTRHRSKNLTLGIEDEDTVVNDMGENVTIGDEAAGTVFQAQGHGEKRPLTAKEKEERKKRKKARRKEQKANEMRR